MNKWLLVAVAISAGASSCTKRKTRTIDVAPKPGDSGSADGTADGGGGSTSSGTKPPVDDPSQDSPSDTTIPPATDPDALGNQQTAGGQLPSQDPSVSSGDPFSTRDRTGVATGGGLNNTIPQQVSTSEAARLLNITPEQAAAGKAYVNGLNGEAPWDGTVDEPDANSNWRLRQPTFTGGIANGSAGTGSSFGSTLGQGFPGQGQSGLGLPGQGQSGLGLPGQGQSGLGQNAGLAGEGQFRIAAGTGDRDWNSEANPIRGRVGGSIVIFNDDSVPHQIHMGADTIEAFEHGDVIPPGGSATYSPSQPAQGITYDHISNQNGRRNQIFLQIQ